MGGGLESPSLAGLDISPPMETQSSLTLSHLYTMANFLAGQGHTLSQTRSCHAYLKLIEINLHMSVIVLPQQCNAPQTLAAIIPNETPSTVRQNPLLSNPPLNHLRNNFILYLKYIFFKLIFSSKFSS